MPGNYGPPYSDLTPIRREGGEIVWAETAWHRVGAASLAVVFLCVAVPWIGIGFVYVREFFADAEARALLLSWRGGETLWAWFFALFSLSGGTFALFALRGVFRQAAGMAALKDWRLQPAIQRAEYRCRPLFGPAIHDVLGPGSVAGVCVARHEWARGRGPYWVVTLKHPDGAERRVDYGKNESDLRALAADFAETFRLPLPA
jgi:hypothetical protein